jgi:hypothetical protein
MPLAALPVWLYELIAERPRRSVDGPPATRPTPERLKRYGEAALEKGALPVACAKSGMRNATLYREAVSLAELVGADCGGHAYRAEFDFDPGIPKSYEASLLLGLKATSIKGFAETHRKPNDHHARRECDAPLRDIGRCCRCRQCGRTRGS